MTIQSHSSRPRARPPPLIRIVHVNPAADFSSTVQSLTNPLSDAPAQSPSSSSSSSSCCSSPAANNATNQVPNYANDTPMNHPHMLNYAANPHINGNRKLYDANARCSTHEMQALAFNKFVMLLCICSLHMALLVLPPCTGQYVENIPARTTAWPNLGRRLLQTGSDNSANMSSSLWATEVDFLEWVSQVAAREHETASTIIFYSSAAAANNSNVITVSKSGSADYSTVQAAVNAVPSDNNQRVVIQIAAGTYKEKVDIPKGKDYISFTGAGSDVTTITWDDTATSAGSTFKSASVAVNSDFFIARDIAFKNSAKAPPPGAVGKQAVALRISGDKASFFSCKFYGAQDTLYDHKGRHYFKGCFIQGSIDFIFGDGQSFYDGCQLNSIASSSGSLTAQKREKPSENTGFSFVNCKVTGSGMIYLGRAWGAYSRVVFLFTYIDDIIVPTGWNDFGDSSNQETAFYGEYQCSGPGASSKNRVTWSYQLTAEQAAPFQSLAFIDGESWVET